MDQNPFPKSPESSKLSGTSPNGGTASMDMDPVGDSTSSRPMTATPDTSGSERTAAPTGQADSSRFTAMAHDTVDKLASVARRYSDSPNKAMEASKTMMKDKPMLALGAALALGLLLGRMTSR